jgi:hypothetical protein
MGRIRTIKPELFRHELLQDLEQRHAALRPMLVFVGLMAQADREGRFNWNPRVLKLDVLPFIDFDLSASMDLLVIHGFIQRYEVDAKAYGYFPTWARHQVVNARERESMIPPPPPTSATRETEASITAASRVDDASRTRESRDTETHVHARGELEMEGNMEQGRERNNASPSAPFSLQQESRKKGEKRGTRIPENFAVTDEHRRFAQEENLPNPEAEVGKFCDYWRARPGKDAVKLDWDATFRNWLRNAAEYSRSAAGRSPASAPKLSRPVYENYLDDPIYASDPPTSAEVRQ